MCQWQHKTAQLKIECPVADAKEGGVRNPAEETLCHRTVFISHIPQPNAIHSLSFACSLLPLKISWTAPSTPEFGKNPSELLRVQIEVAVRPDDKIGAGDFLFDRHLRGDAPPDLLRSPAAF